MPAQVVSTLAIALLILTILLGMLLLLLLIRRILLCISRTGLIISKFSP